MGSKTYWIQVAERAAKAFAGTLVTLLGAGAVDVTHIPWTTDLGIALGATVVSVLLSIASAGAGAPDSPSLVPVTPDQAAK